MNSLNIMYSKDERANRRGHLEERNIQSGVLIADQSTLCLLLNNVCEIVAMGNNKQWLED